MQAREFERIYEAHVGAIAAYALRRARNEADAEEIHAERRRDPRPADKIETALDQQDH